VNVNLRKDLLELGSIKRSADKMKSVLGRDNRHTIVLPSLLD